MLTGPDRIAVAHRAHCCEKTVTRVYQGKGGPYTKRRVADAARALGLPPPEGASELAVPQRSVA